MTILEKLNFLVQANRMIKEIKMLDKLKGAVGKLDGLKSTLGLLAVVAYYAGPQFGVHVPDVVLKIGSGLASVGIAHKLEKGAGVLTKAIDVASKGLAVMKGVVDAMNKKEGEAK